MDSVCDFQRFVIETQENKLRLDVYLAMVTPYTRSYIKSLIDKGHVTVNGKKCRVLGHIGMLHTVCDVTSISCSLGDKAIVNINPLMLKGMDVVWR